MTTSSAGAKAIAATNDGSPPSTPATDQSPGQPHADAAAQPAHLPPEIVEAEKAFRSELPLLLRERPGQWVAYVGRDRLGLARTKTELYQACLRQGHPRGGFLVRCIEPLAGEELTGLREIG